MSLGEKQHKTLQKIVCRIELDSGYGTMSSLSRHWAWYNGKRCRVQLDIGPIRINYMSDLFS